VVKLHISLFCYLVAHKDISLLLNSIARLGHRAKTIDNFLDSGIMVSITVGSTRIPFIRNRISRLISRWAVKCLSQGVVVVPTMLSRAHIEM